MLPAVLVVLALVLSLEGAPSPQPPVVPAVAPPTSSTGSKIWVGREAEFEEFLRTAEVDRIENVPVGVTKPVRAFFRPGGLCASIVFKPLRPGRHQGYWESYKAEIAAYELDKLLGLGMVPPTVERRVEADLGSAQLWVEGVTLLKDRDPTTSGRVVEWNRQVHRQRLWDNLTGNIDRNAGNLLVDQEWNLILIDHSRALTSTGQMPFKMTRIDRPFYTRLKSLTEEELKAAIGEYLIDGVKPILKRRDKIVQHFEQLIARQGEAAVLTP